MRPKRKKWWEIDDQQEIDQMEKIPDTTECTLQRETRSKRIVEVLTVRQGNLSPLIHTRQTLAKNDRIASSNSGKKLMNLSDLCVNSLYDDDGNDLTPETGVQCMYDDTVYSVRNNPLFEVRIL
ncbi:hypothetical protein R1flu_014951 [Riccia fluitans]|uniref:Uncharacterized protein n=1 Tax=Riccia fluitans TaxID=41844 RepID=A0ABD1YIE7_9MARC